MGTYYVSTSGNDTTGNGSEGAPWRTINKAITTIPTNAEHTVLIAPGTYAEDTSGAGYLNIISARTEWLTIESATGNAEDVTITGTSGATYNILFGVGTTAKIKFSKVTLTNYANTSQYVVAFHANSIVSNVVFDGCRFVLKVGGNTKTKIAIIARPNALKTCQSVTIQNCTFTEEGVRDVSETVQPVSMSRTDAAATLDAITFANNTVVGQHFGPLFIGVTNIACTDNTIQADTGVALTLGSDYGTTTPTTSGTVSGNRTRSGSSHGLLLGNGCDSVIAQGNIVIGGNNGIVIKNAANVVVRGNLVYGPSSMISAIYIKGSSSTGVYGNVAMCTHAGGWVFRAGYDPLPNPDTLYSGASVIGNTFIARNGAHIYLWGPDAEEAGETSVCNQNVLVQAGSGNYGTVKGTADIATLAALRSAWAGYDVSTNDSQSVDGELAWYAALGACMGGGTGLGI